MPSYTSLQKHFRRPDFWGRTTQPALGDASCNTFWQLFGINFCKKPKVKITVLLRISDDRQTERSIFSVLAHTVSKALHPCAPLLWRHSHALLKQSCYCCDCGVAKFCSSSVGATKSNSCLPPAIRKSRVT